MTAVLYGTECDFVSGARISYAVGDNIVRVLNDQRRNTRIGRKPLFGELRSILQDIETNLWGALQRDFPKFKFRRKNQVIIVNYNSTEIYINPGEDSKIKSWGVNDYSDALDTINQLQSGLWDSGSRLGRNWERNWKRLDLQLDTIYRRNCLRQEEPSPGPIGIQPPICLPEPPEPPGPYICWPPLPIPTQAFWSANEKRNWGVIGWNTSDMFPATAGYQINRPSINMVDGRELIVYRTPGTTVTKLVWLFHSNGGSARSWFRDYEKVKYVKKLVDAGYAVAAYDSYNRVTKKWTLSANPVTNRDVLGLQSAQDFLAQAGIIRKVCTAVQTINPYTGVATVSQTCGFINLNQFGVGHGTGGDLASYAASTIGLSKVVLHNSTGATTVIRGTSYAVKTLWMVSNNDLTVNNSLANDNYNYLLSNNSTYAGGYYNQQGTKITSAIFDAIPEISTPVADAIVAGMISGGFFTTGGVLASKYQDAGRALRETYLQQTIPAIISAAFGNDQATYRKFDSDIMGQLKIAFSDHKFIGWQRTESVGTLVLVDRDLAFLNS